MKPTRHKITHHYQPTNNTCGYASLAVFLSFYGKEYTPEQLVDKVPQPKNEKGKPTGSVTTQLVDWVQSQGFQIHMYSSDCLVLDLSWQHMDSRQIIDRLKAVKATRHVPALGNYWTKVYIDSYISMLDGGSELSTVPFITTGLLYKLLKNGPIYVNVCATALNGKGRMVHPGLREDVADDTNGAVSTHSVVVYGNDDKGNFLVADPWEGLIEVESEKMVLAIEAAQIECDNQCFVVEKS